MGPGPEELCPTPASSCSRGGEPRSSRVLFPLTKAPHSLSEDRVHMLCCLPVASLLLSALDSQLVWWLSIFLRFYFCAYCGLSP